LSCLCNQRGSSAEVESCAKVGVIGLELGS
jgi:hypothetical protein